MYSRLTLSFQNDKSPEIPQIISGISRQVYSVNPSDADFDLNAFQAYSLCLAFEMFQPVREPRQKIHNLTFEEIARYLTSPSKNIEPLFLESCGALICMIVYERELEDFGELDLPTLTDAIVQILHLCEYTWGFEEHPDDISHDQIIRVIAMGAFAMYQSIINLEFFFEWQIWQAKNHTRSPMAEMLWPKDVLELLDQDEQRRFCEKVDDLDGFLNYLLRFEAKFEMFLADILVKLLTTGDY